MFLPNIIETVGKNSKVLDLPSKLLSDRIVYLGTEVSDESANIVIMQLLWLASNNPNEEIDFYINSPGGSVYAGLGIKDIIDQVDKLYGCKVNTIAVGCVASMGAYLTACGTGTRRATRNTRIMIHSVSSGTQGTYHDMKIDFKETEYLQNKLMVHIANYSKGKSTFEDINKMCERDKWLEPDEAIKIGLIDAVI